jgi:hypothetical protein
MIIQKQKDKPPYKKKPIKVKKKKSSRVAMQPYVRLIYVIFHATLLIHVHSPILPSEWLWVDVTVSFLRPVVLVKLKKKIHPWLVHVYIYIYTIACMSKCTYACFIPPTIVIFRSSRARGEYEGAHRDRAQGRS